MRLAWNLRQHGAYKAQAAHPPLLHRELLLLLLLLLLLFLQKTNSGSTGVILDFHFPF
jgi:hypothetical protein